MMSRVFICFLLCGNAYLFANQASTLKVDVLGSSQHLYEAVGPVTTIELTSDQFQDDKKIITVDDQGNVIEHTVEYFNEQLKERTNFHYNEHGQLVEVVTLLAKS